MRGAAGSLAPHGAPGVRFVHLPGHTLGHVGLLHEASGALLPSDFADIINCTQPRGCALPDGRTVAPGLFLMNMCDPPCNPAHAHESICRLAYDPSLEYTRLYASHDGTKRGLTREQLRPLAEAYSKCGGWMLPRAT